MSKRPRHAYTRVFPSHYHVFPLFPPGKKGNLMWPMRRTTCAMATTGLLALSWLFVFGFIALLYTGWLEKADVIV